MVLLHSQAQLRWVLCKSKHRAFPLSFLMGFPVWRGGEMSELQTLGTMFEITIMMSFLDTNNYPSLDKLELLQENVENKN